MSSTFPKTLTSARAIALTAAAVCFALVAFAPAVLNDADTYWHIAAGRWMLDNQAVLRIDPFSYTFAGHPWLTHEWLAEIAMALVYVGAGWSGVMLLFAATTALTAGMLARHLSRWMGGITLIATLVMSLACMAASLLARPHLLALPLLELWTAELIIASEQGRRPSLWLLPVMALWANLHASFLFGLGLIVPLGVEAALDHAPLRKLLEQWGVFAGLALGAALLTPHGIDGLVFPLKLMAMPQLNLINEWKPTDLSGMQPLAIAVGLALFALLSRGAKIRPVRLLLLLAVFYLALVHARHQMLLAVAGSLLIAGPLAAALQNSPHRDAPSASLGLVLAFVPLFAVIVALRLLMPLERSDDITTPAAALAHVPAAIARQPVLNDYSFGGYLIFNDVRPFIDGRAELYGGEFLDRYAQIIRPNQKVIEATLAKYHVRWTILAPSNPAVAVMDTMAGWHRLYADRWAVVHVRDGEP